MKKKWCILFPVFLTTCHSMVFHICCGFYLTEILWGQHPESGTANFIRKIIRILRGFVWKRRSQVFVFTLEGSLTRPPSEIESELNLKTKRIDDKHLSNQCFDEFHNGLKMAGRNQNDKSRSDYGKWGFEGETDYLRVLKKDGPLETSNKKMTKVNSVCESSGRFFKCWGTYNITSLSRQHCVNGLTVSPVTFHARVSWPGTKKEDGSWIFAVDLAHGREPWMNNTVYFLCHSGSVAFASLKERKDRLVVDTN